MVYSSRHSLIGEHIDYALFGVFPAAVECDILIACASAENRPSGCVVADNLYPKYTQQTFTPGFTALEKKTEHDDQGWHLEIDKGKLRWESYVKAGYYVSLIGSMLVLIVVSLLMAWSDIARFSRAC